MFLFWGKAKFWLRQQTLHKFAVFKPVQKWPKNNILTKPYTFTIVRDKLDISFLLFRFRSYYLCSNQNGSDSATRNLVSSVEKVDKKCFIGLARELKKVSGKEALCIPPFRKKSVPASKKISFYRISKWNHFSHKVMVSLGGKSFGNLNHKG